MELKALLTDAPEKSFMRFNFLPSFLLISLYKFQMKVKRDYSQLHLFQTLPSIYQVGLVAGPFLTQLH